MSSNPGALEGIDAGTLDDQHGSDVTGLGRDRELHMQRAGVRLGRLDGIIPDAAAPDADDKTCGCKQTLPRHEVMMKKVVADVAQVAKSIRLMTDRLRIRRLPK